MAQDTGNFKKLRGGQGTVTLTLSSYEQFISHVRTWLSKYHLSYSEIEEMPLSVLFDLEVVDSKIDAAFDEKSRSKEKKMKKKRRLEDYI